MSMTTGTTPSQRPQTAPVFLRKDVLAGLLFMAVAVIGLWVSHDYPIGTALRMGTGYVPRLLCWILLGLGVIIAAQGVLGAGQAAFPRGEARWRPLVFVPASLLAFTFSIERLGVVVATVLLVAIGALAGRGLRAIEVVLTAALLAALMVGVFVWALGLPIPLWPER
jgi:hypothetical protein